MTRKSGKTCKTLVRSLTDSAYYFEKRGPSGPRFFLRLFTVNHAEARRRRPSPNVPASTHRAERHRTGPGPKPDMLEHATGDRRPATGEKKQGAAEHVTGGKNRPAAEPILTPDNGPRTAARGRRTGKKRHGARGHRVIFSGQKISGDGQIFAARRVAAQVLVPCFSQIIM